MMDANEKNLLRAVGHLARVVDEFFKNGDLPVELAYAHAVIGLACVENLLYENESSKKVIDFCESNPEHFGMIFQTDQAILNQIDNLKEQLEMLRPSTAPRDSLIWVGKEPQLRLVHPAS